MPEKTKTYNRVVFKPEVIKEAENELVSTLGKKDRELTREFLTIRLSAMEQLEHDTEEEFFADYIKGFEYANFIKTFNVINEINFWIFEDDSRVSVSLPRRADVEKVFNCLERNVEKCRLPKRPQEKPKTKTDWVTETTEKVEGYFAPVGRKLRLALSKIESDEAEEWQGAAMLIRDAWIELSHHLCGIKQVDTVDINADAVIDRLRRLGIEKADEKIFNLARSSFNLAFKHHDREITRDETVACILSSLVAMQIVIREGI